MDTHTIEGQLAAIERWRISLGMTVADYHEALQEGADKDCCVFLKMLQWQTNKLQRDQRDMMETLRQLRDEISGETRET